MDSTKYNSTREKLLLPEYGRNVVKMVEELKKVTDREERTRQAHFIINVMGSINPTLRDSNDHKHKLWDHLYIIADFDLDIDAPYDMPEREVLEFKPEIIDYRQKSFTHKQYGNNVREMIEELVRLQEMEGEDIIDTAIEVAKFMRQKSYEYNKEYPSNEVVLSDFRRFSAGKIILDEDVLDASHVSINRPKPRVNNMQSRGSYQQGGQNRNNPNSGMTNRRNNNNNNNRH